MKLKSLFVQENPSKDLTIFIKQRAPIYATFKGNEHLFKLKNHKNHLYHEIGTGPAIIFSPGIYGGVENIVEIAVELSNDYTILIPYLPMYDLPLKHCNVYQLGVYLDQFIHDIELKQVVIIGSSMGGGAALNLALLNNDALKGLVLCGSSGLSTIPMRKGFFRRKDYNYVKQTAQDVFYDPDTPSEEMIKGLFSALQKNELILRSIRFTKSTKRDQLHEKLKDIKVKVLLIWGKQDTITPPEIGTIFKDLLPDSNLYLIDKCGHVPTQERPKEVLPLLQNFFDQIAYYTN